MGAMVTISSCQTDIIANKLRSQTYYITMPYHLPTHTHDRSALPPYCDGVAYLPRRNVHTRLRTLRTYPFANLLRRLRVAFWENTRTMRILHGYTYVALWESSLWEYSYLHTYQVSCGRRLGWVVSLTKTKPQHLSPKHLAHHRTLPSCRDP